MPQDSTEIRLYGDGGLKIAPVDTPMPTAHGEELDPAFVDLGFTNPDGIVITIAREIADVNAWQSPYPVRKNVTSESASVAATLLQSNTDVIQSALGGTIVSDGGDGWMWEPDEFGTIREWAIIAEGLENGQAVRWCFPRVFNQGEFTFSFLRSDSAVFPVDFAALQPADGPVHFALYAPFEGIGVTASA